MPRKTSQLTDYQIGKMLDPVLCAKLDPSLLTNGVAVKNLLLSDKTVLKNLLHNEKPVVKSLLLNNVTASK